MLFLLGVKELGSKGVKTLVFLFIPLPSERSGGGWLIPTKKALVRQRRSALNIMSILKRCHKKIRRPCLMLSLPPKPVAVFTANRVLTSVT